MHARVPSSLIAPSHRQMVILALYQSRASAGSASSAGMWTGSDGRGAVCHQTTELHLSKPAAGMLSPVSSRECLITIPLGRGPVSSPKSKHDGACTDGKTSPIRWDCFHAGLRRRHVIILMACIAFAGGMTYLGLRERWRRR